MGALCGRRRPRPGTGRARHAAGLADRHLPQRPHKPFAEPAPRPLTDDGDTAFALNPGLADWAFALTRDIKLADDATAGQGARALFRSGRRAAFVIEGDGLMSSRFWYGAHMTAWAERWVPYWTRGKGVFAMSAEEDTGVMQALTFLARAGRVRTDRVLMLRAASDYVAAPAGHAGRRLRQPGVPPRPAGRA